MFKKSVAFGLLAASLAIAPGAAFADSQVQTNDQDTQQSGASFDSGTTIQKSTTDNNQNQRIRETGRSRFGDRNKQRQDSIQTTDQDGASEGHGVTVQDSDTKNEQDQTINNRRRVRRSRYKY